VKRSRLMGALKDFLLELSLCEREIEDLSRRKQQLPEAIARAVAEAEKVRAALAERRRELAEAEKTRRSKEAELKDLEVRREKFQGQTAQVKTNEEYSALLHQIEDAGVRISHVEDDILNALETAEAISADLAVSEKQSRELEQAHQREADQLRAQLGDVEKSLEALETQRASLAGQLPPDLAPRYGRVRGASGSGTAPLAGRSCGRCHRDVPYETINRIRAGEGHVCGNCGRILVVHDAPAGAPPA
jgi:uncharacterized protein